MHVFGKVKTPIKKRTQNTLSFDDVELTHFLYFVQFYCDHSFNRGVRYSRTNHCQLPMFYPIYRLLPEFRPIFSSNFGLRASPPPSRTNFLHAVSFPTNIWCQAVKAVRLSGHRLTPRIQMSVESKLALLTVTIISDDIDGHLISRKPSINITLTEQRIAASLSTLYKPRPGWLVGYRLLNRRSPWARISGMTTAEGRRSGRGFRLLLLREIGAERCDTMKVYCLLRS